MRRPVRLITAVEIKEHYTMEQAINAMKRAFSALSSGESYVPHRYISKLPSENMYLFFKPAFVEQEERIAVKFLTQRQTGLMPGIPVIQGIVILIDSVTGEIVSIMDGEYLTALRTGAASGLATRYFSREDARVMALFGCGAQGRTQLEAIICERRIEKVFVFDSKREAAEAFIAELKDKFPLELVYVSDTSVLQEVDVICTATNSREPLFRIGEVKKGVHINAVGSFQPEMQELDPFLIRDARIYVDQAESCLKESGDLIKPMADGIITSHHIAGEIGDYCLNKIAGRESDDQITVFKSVGNAIQDFMVAVDVYNHSVNESFGVDFNLFG